MSTDLYRQEESQRDPHFRNAKGRMGGHFDRIPLVLRDDMLDRCRSLPFVKNLFVTHIGAFTSAPRLYTERPNGFHTALIIYCLEGKGFLEMQGQSMKISQGQAFLIPKYIPHVYGANNRDPWSNFWIHFDGNQAEDVIELLSIDKSHPVLYIPDIPLMKHLFENVYVCLKTAITDESLLESHGELLRFTIKMRKSMVSAPDKVNLDFSSLAETIAFMKDHLDARLDLEDLTSYSNQSKSQLFRNFKEKTGQSPLNFFLKLKMEKACEMLVDTDLHIREIAERLGYDDPYYFSRVFKKIAACPPSEYRERNQSETIC